MARRKPLVIAGTKIKLGESKDLHLDFSESYWGGKVRIPIRVFRAKRSGPRVFVTGAVHGDELTGVGIVREILYEKPPELKKGTLICVPVVNTFAMEQQTRYLPDGRDLNRFFPGSATGSMTSRLANYVFEEIVMQCDYGIDFHSAASRRTNYPNVRADMKNAEAKRLARAFGAELIVDSKGPAGSLRREATRNGVPTIILEAGEIFKIVPNVVEMGVKGITNILKMLEMVEGESEKPLFQVTIEKTTWVRADRGGFLSFHAKPGDFVNEGQFLATNYNIFGRERNLITSPASGVVLGMTTMPAVLPGEPVYHIAKLAKRTYNRLSRLFEKTDENHAFQQMQDTLSTQLIIQERED